MKKVFMLVVGIMFFAVAAQAAGLDVIGQSGGYLVPNAQISNRLAVSTTYTNLDKNAANDVAVSLGVLKHLEVSYARQDNQENIYGAKLGFSFKKKTLATSFALGVVSTNIQSVSGLNALDAYLAGQLGFQILKHNVDAVLVLNSTDSFGTRKYLGQASVGVEVVKGWDVYGEFVQNPEKTHNQMSAFVQRDLGNAVIKAGVADLAGNKLDNQFFLSASILGI